MLWLRMKMKFMAEMEHMHAIALHEIRSAKVKAEYFEKKMAAEGLGRSAIPHVSTPQIDSF